MKIPSTKKQLVWNFENYCAEFYVGNDAVYPFNCSYETLRNACQLVALRNHKSRPFLADTENREQVREILVALGYTEIERSKEERKERADRALAELKAMGESNA
jgi:hypothetical protein|tara:strand:- start:21 stop:332 length:312 start_codon:yes stop_codon:yes gene_type:complete